MALTSAWPVAASIAAGILFFGFVLIPAFLAHNPYLKMAATGLKPIFVLLSCAFGGIALFKWLGIDAPERKQPFGERARQNLAHLAFAQEVTVQWKKKHRNRLIGKVLVNGVDVSLEQIKSGMAWWYEAYRKDQTERDRTLYSAHEAEARQSRVGLWQDPAPVAPWDWRHRRK